MLYTCGKIRRNRLIFALHFSIDFVLSLDWFILSFVVKIVVELVKNSGIWIIKMNFSSITKPKCLNLIFFYHWFLSFPLQFIGISTSILLINHSTESLPTPCKCSDWLAHFNVTIVFEDEFASDLQYVRWDSSIVRFRRRRVFWFVFSSWTCVQQANLSTIGLHSLFAIDS